MCVWILSRFSDDDNGVEKVDDREEVEKFEIGGKKPVATESATATTDSSAAKDDVAQDPAGDDDDDGEIDKMTLLLLSQPTERSENLPIQKKLRVWWRVLHH